MLRPQRASSDGPGLPAGHTAPEVRRSSSLRGRLATDIQAHIQDIQEDIQALDESMRRIFSLHHQTRRPSSNTSLPYEPPNLSSPPPPPADASDLPPELWEKVLAAITTDDPCDEIVKLCALNRKWAGMCRDGSLYDAANRALGWYGKQGTWPNVLALYAALRDDPPGGGTPKGYFQYACNTMGHGREAVYPRFPKPDHVRPWHPFYSAIMLRAVRKNPRQFHVEQIPGYVPGYAEIVGALVDNDPYKLGDVRRDHPAFKQIALNAIDNYAKDESFGENGAAVVVRMVAPRMAAAPSTFHQPFHRPVDQSLLEEIVTIAVRKYGWKALRYRVPYGREGGVAGGKLWYPGWRGEANEIKNALEHTSEEFQRRMETLAGPYIEPPPLPPPPRPPWHFPPGGFPHNLGYPPGVAPPWLGNTPPLPPPGGYGP